MQLLKFNIDRILIADDDDDDHLLFNDALKELTQSIQLAHVNDGL